jgi:serine O-acetyltransferase
MIKSKSDYKHYLNSDSIALGKTAYGFSQRMREMLYPDPVWKFQRLMRKVEYYNNVKRGVFFKLYTLYLKYRYAKLSLRLGFSIPINVFGPGLSIVHYGTIVVNHNARVGKNCRIHACTNIGASGGSNKAPVLGDNIYVAPGAKIYGDIRLGNNIAISANAVVNKSFSEENVMLAGVPARVIKPIEISNIIKHIKQS